MSDLPRTPVAVSDLPTYRTPLGHVPKLGRFDAEEGPSTFQVAGDYPVDDDGDLDEGAARQVGREQPTERSAIEWALAEGVMRPASKEELASASSEDAEGEESETATPEP